MDQIKIDNIRIFAYHGCLKEEERIGSDYRVDLTIKTNLNKSAQTDRLSDTVDYVLLNKIVKEEMTIPSHLLEHVAHRTLKRLLVSDGRIKKACITIAKLNPPIEGDVESVAVKMGMKNYMNKSLTFYIKSLIF